MTDEYPSPPDGETVVCEICDWVQGRPLSDMATDYFAGKPGHGDDATGQADSVTAMTRCCRPASAGLGAWREPPEAAAARSRFTAGNQSRGPPNRYRCMCS